jgi:hypothetical protein
MITSKKTIVITMPTVTRTVAKGIPPRQRTPANSKHKAKASKTRKNKRQLDSSDDESVSEASDSEESAAKAKKKRPTKRRRKESSEEVEEVENSSQRPVEEVGDLSDDNGVSVTSTEMTKDSRIL